MLKSLIKRAINATGYKISKAANQPTDDDLRLGHSMQCGLFRAKDICHSINTIVDVGAASGTWTKLAMKRWPNAKYILVEPLSERTEELTALKNQYQNIEFVSAVAGNSSGKVGFSVANDLDGSGVYGKSAKGTTYREIDSVTIDELVDKHRAPGPYLLKLDTHGFELPIFEGAQQTLKQTELIIVECYGFFVSPHAKLFYELCAYLHEAGFRPVDLVDVVNRRKDGAFWQCDIFFARQNNPVFEDNFYA